MGMREGKSQSLYTGIYRFILKIKCSKCCKTSRFLYKVYKKTEWRLALSPYISMCIYNYSTFVELSEFHENSDPNNFGSTNIYSGKFEGYSTYTKENSSNCKILLNK